MGLHVAGAASHHDGHVTTCQRARIETRKLIAPLHPLDKPNVVLVGPNGVGKTMHAKNIAYEVGIITHSCGAREPRELQRMHARVVTANGLSVALNELHPDRATVAPDA